MGSEQSVATSPTKAVTPAAQENPEPTELHRSPSALVVCGPSGVGKGTLIELLLEDSTGFAFSISHTTRPPRGQEKDGVAYNFVSTEEFEKGIEEKAFLEFAKVHSNYYGTSRAAVEKVLDAGACCILDIDVQGARQIRRSGIRAVFVFIAPPSEEELEKRLRGRGTDSEEQIHIRLRTARAEMQSMREPGLFDFCIVNSDLSQAYAELRMIALKAKSGALPEMIENGLMSPTKSDHGGGLNVSGMRAWQKKIALVTDAGSPIGTELCMALSKAGMRVIAVGLNRVDLERLQGTMVQSGHTIVAQNFLPVVCDTAKEEEVLSLRSIAQKRWPNAASVSVLINIAGHTKSNAGLIEGAVSAWEEVINRNILGMLTCCREVIRDMKQRGEWGCILNISIPFVSSPESLPLFRASSSAIRSLTSDLRHEARGKGYDVMMTSLTSDKPVEVIEIAKAAVALLSNGVDAEHVAM